MTKIYALVKSILFMKMFGDLFLLCIMLGMELQVLYSSSIRQSLFLEEITKIRVLLVQLKDTMLTLINGL